jgi:hypothetical protein
MHPPRARRPGIAGCSPTRPLDLPPDTPSGHTYRTASATAIELPRPRRTGQQVPSGRALPSPQVAIRPSWLCKQVVSALSVLAPTQGGLLGDLLATWLWEGAQEPVCAGGRDRFRTCGLCRVNAARPPRAPLRHPASHHISPGQRPCRTGATWCCVWRCEPWFLADCWQDAGRAPT